MYHIIQVLSCFCLVTVYANESWQQGCYERNFENTTRNILNIKISESWSAPEYCTNLCSERSFSYSAIPNQNECICLKDLLALQKLDDSRCNKSCKNRSHLPCGGPGAVSLYGTLVPIIFNTSLSTRQYVPIEEPSSFNASYMLTTSEQHKSQVQNNTAIDTVDDSKGDFVFIVWKVNNVIYKQVNKTIYRSARTDNFIHRFSRPGLHILCFNASNHWSWMSRCASVWVLEYVHTLEVIRVGGGVHVNKGRYAIIESNSVLLDVIVNAGSFARLNFDFGDRSAPIITEPTYQKMMTNCSWLVVVKKKHTYAKKGLFSLNITAYNRLGKKELVFTDVFRVDGVITGGLITTNVAVAGSTSKILVVPYGSFQYAAYQWEFQRGKVVITTEPYVRHLFLTNAAHVHVKVVIFNNVSRVVVEKTIYVEPKITSVFLTAKPSLTTVGQVVRFETTLKPRANVAWTARFNYIWYLGDGSTLYGTVPEITYRYTKHGSFRAWVKVKNLANSASSNNVHVTIYEMIEKLDVYYKPFRFGQSTIFQASVSGSHVTYFWDFGDSTKANTTDSSIHHTYKKPGNYTFTVLARNLVSQKAISSTVFVTDFECQKPVVAFALGHYQENIVFSSKIRVEVEVSLNCSISRKVQYQWKIFAFVNGRKVKKYPSGIGVNSTVWKQRTLIIPPFALHYGRYVFELKVQIKDTIIYASMDKLINIVPTGLNAVIKGGTVKSVGRRNHENITLDASGSYDPDFRHQSNLRFSWDCRSINGTHHMPCFKTDTALGLNLSQPVIKFLPRILVNTANTFAFTVTITKPGLSEATATQFLELQNDPLYHLDVQCAECNKIDVNSHKEMKFTSRCKRCGSNVSYAWKIFLVPVQKVFLNYFGKCIKPDGSTWKEAENVNHTNATTTKKTTMTKSPSTAKLTTLTPVTMTRNSSTDSGKADKTEEVICLKDLKVLIKNYTGLRYVNLSRINSHRPARRRRDIQQVLPDLGEHDSVINANSFRDEDGIFDGDMGKVDEFEISPEFEDLEASIRSRRAVASGNNSSKQSQGVVPNTRQLVKTNAPVIRGSLSGLSTGGRSSSNGAGYSSSTGRSGYAPQKNLLGRMVIGGNVAKRVGTGGGRVPGTGGSGGGCDYGSGFKGTRASGSGTGGSSAGCNGNKDKFGEGAKNQKNKTGESGNGSGGSNGGGGGEGSGSSSQNWKINQRDNYLREKLGNIRQIMHPASIAKDKAIGFTTKDFTMKPDAIVPGQYYMVQLMAYWQTGSGKRLAGQAKTYFNTNTGPFLGSCQVLPHSGYEITTVFSLKCDHWKDQHFPLKYTVRYKAKAVESYSYIYRGFKSKLNFTLPAGDAATNYTVGLELDIEDSEGVKTNLCPIDLQVLPLKDQRAPIEEKMYNWTFGRHSSLKLYGAISDINSAIILASTYANSLNRLSRVTKMSSKFQLRQRIRASLLANLEAYKLVDEELAYQHITLIRDATKVFEEVSLKSVQLSAVLLRRWIDLEAALSTQLLKEIFQVTSTLLESTILVSNVNPNTKSLRSSVLDILFIQETFVKSKKLHDGSGSPLKLETSFSSTLTSYHKKMNSSILSIAGCSFIMPTTLRNSFEDLSTKFTTSRMTVYAKSPFTWKRNTVRIDSKVVNVVLETSAGKEIKVSNLINPVTINLPINKSQTTETSHLLQVSQMNIHKFNVSCHNKSTTLFVRIQEIDAAEGNENYQLKALLRFDKAPTKILFNDSLTFEEKTASITYSPMPDVSEIFIGVFMQPLGRKVKKKRNLPWFKYNISLHSARCLFWDSHKELWSSDGCHASKTSSTSNLICRCNHMTSFGGHIEYLTSTLNVQSHLIFNEFNDASIVLISILVITAIYCLLLLYFLNIERRTKPRTAITNLPDNHPADLFKYLVICETGCSVGAGTSARVSVVFHGEEGYSQIRELTCHDVSLFQRGATDCVIVSFPDSLGEIRKIELWHDGSGSSPEWFLKQITIVDCQTEDSWYFSLNDWLAVGEHTRVDCELPATKTPRISILQTLFEGFLDYHLWISIFAKPGRSCLSSIQRLTCCFVSLLGYMCVISSYLQMPALKNEDNRGIWDLSWLAITISLFANFTILPLQMMFEFILRNSGRVCCKASHENDVENDEAEPHSRGSGALYYINMLSQQSSAENSVKANGNESVSRRVNLKEDASEFLLPNWCNNLCLVICFMVAVASASFTLLLSMGFDQGKMFQFSQALLLSLCMNIFGVSPILALLAGFRRLYVLYKEYDMKKYLKMFGRLEKSTGKSHLSSHLEISEEKIMAARDRARFIRFSKPLTGGVHRKARRGAIFREDLISFIREFVMLLIYYLTLFMVLSKVKVNESYLQQNAVRSTITSPSMNGSSFEEISSSDEFWDWSDSKLPDILLWDSWNHLQTIYGARNPIKVKRRNVYTFGPARLWKEEDSQITSPKASASNYSSSLLVESSILLVGKRETMLSTLRKLRMSNWINRTTKHVHIDFSYYHPETDSYSFVQLQVDVPEYGVFHSSMKINNAQLHFKFDTLQIWTCICQVFFLLCVLISLRREYCSLMDRGLGYLFEFWSLVEAIFICTTIVGVAVQLLDWVALQRTLFQAHSMYLNDAELFLDLSSLVFYQQLSIFVYSLLLFCVIIKTLRTLCIWNRFADLCELLRLAAYKLRSYLVVMAIIMAALSHSGKILLASTTWYFSETRTAMITFWSMIDRSSSFITDDSNADNSCIYRLYTVTALMSVFILWRISVVLFIGAFVSSKSEGKRKILPMKTTSKRLRKLIKKKHWTNLLKSIKNRFWKRPETKYEFHDIPLESVFEEIEYQVEEVVFRMNNLFKMQDMSNAADSIRDCDSETLDSSDEAAYPSSYSTQDNISYTSESICSDDSGYRKYSIRDNRFFPVCEADDEYEGPVIHHLDEPQKGTNDSAQMLSPIFGGRNFVKTSWSTFRVPKIRPGSIECKPPSLIRLPELKGKKTFEKLEHWSSTRCAKNPDDSKTEVIGFRNAAFEAEKNDGDDSHLFVGKTRIKLPKALNFMCGNFPPAQDPKFDPFQRPKLPPMIETLGRSRKRLPFKRSQVTPFDLESTSTRSSSGSDGSSFHLPSRSPSLDSGIVRSSETDEGEASETSFVKRHVSGLFEVPSSKFHASGNANTKYSW